LTNVFPQTQPVVVTVTPSSPIPLNITTITAGPVNQPLVSYHFVQNIPAATWTIVHNLGWYPNVTIQDSAGSIVEGEIAYTSVNALTVTFSSAFSGNAYLS
jgi:hypothetical protein